MNQCQNCRSSNPPNVAFCPACGVRIVRQEPSPKDPWIGRVVRGDFVIVELLGEGGMGRVYRAEQRGLGRSVAIKLVHGHIAHDPSVASQFAMEARAASRLSHPHSLTVMDFGQLESGELYQVMEFLRGRDLSRVMADEDPLPQARSLDLLRQVLDALSEAHSIGLVHRDIKPHNIMVEPLRTGGDFVKLVDFGLARFLSKVRSAGHSVSLAGTPEYMSPEQASGEPGDARSDLYAVGVVLFRLLTGRVPFRGATPTATLLAQMTSPVPDPRDIAPERLIGADLANVTCKALSKDPWARFASAQEFCDALRAARQGEMGNSFSPPAAVLRTTESGFGASSDEEATTRNERLDHFGMPMTGRTDDIDWLRKRISGVGGEAVWARLVGESGVGKTRLLEEFARLLPSGQKVVFAGPDPWRVGVPFRAVRHLIEALAGSDLQSLAGAADQGIADAGVFLEPASDEEDACATPDATGWVRLFQLALATAHKRNRDGCVVVLIDDLDWVDAPSQRVIAVAAASRIEVPALIVGAHENHLHSPWVGRTPSRVLYGWTRQEAVALCKRVGADNATQALVMPELLPLHVEQAVRYSLDGGDAAPPRLGDLIAQRASLLSQSRRALVGSLALLARPVPLTIVAEVCGLEAPPCDDADALLRAGWIKVRNGLYQVAHPILSRLTLTGMPKELRCALCRRAADVEVDLPGEAKARLLLDAGRIFEALVLLDSIAAKASARRDWDGALNALRLAVVQARQHGDALDPQSSVRVELGFRVKLADVLIAVNRPTEAETTLLELLAACSTPEEHQMVTSALRTVMGRDVDETNAACPN